MTTIDEVSRRIDEIADRLRVNARKNFIGRDEAKKSRALTKAVEAMHAAKRDRVEKREAEKYAEAIERKSPATRLTAAQIRAEHLGFKAWDRAYEVHGHRGITGGLKLWGYV